MPLTHSDSRFPMTRKDCVSFAARVLTTAGRISIIHSDRAFQEMDTVVIFDEVFAPWEQIVLYRDIQRCNEAYARRGAVVHMTHQVVVKNIAKCEFMLGLASPMVNSIGAEVFQHMHEKLAEIW
jgi:aromatic ring hydroxylase